MSRGRHAFVVIAIAITACGTRTRRDPPKLEEITAWAHDGGWRVSSAGCNDVEQRSFGAVAATCWFAKRRTPELGTDDVYPRVDIDVVAFADEAAAKARMARFREIPDDLHGEDELVYPLRAGFRVGERVVLVTTDALRFQDETYRAAMALAARVGGSDVTCWLGCPAAGGKSSGLSAPATAAAHARSPKRAKEQGVPRARRLQHAAACAPPAS